MIGSRRIFLKSALLLLLVVLISCSNDDDPVKPPFQFSPTLETLWPHADGNSWTYHLKTEKCDNSESELYENLEDVPPIPSFEELYARLGMGSTCEQPDISSGSLNLNFDGVVAISPGDTVQRLRSSVEADEGWPITPLGFSGGLWAMRQDSIVAYPDWKNDDRISWLYLTGDLEPGVEFSFRLPGIEAELYLHEKIWRHSQQKLPNQSFVNCVECFYLLDLGIQQATDESGEPRGYFRTYFYGTVLYAEGIGPILFREQRDEGPDITIDPTGRRLTMTLAYLTDWYVQ